MSFYFLLEWDMLFFLKFDSWYIDPYMTTNFHVFILVNICT